jgi:hypothetical protein
VVDVVLFLLDDEEEMSYSFTDAYTFDSVAEYFKSFFQIKLHNMSPPLSHDDFRKRVCGGCFLLTRKKEVRNITKSMLACLRLYQWEGYSLSNNALPTVLCGSCRLKLTRRKSVSALST